MRARGLLAGLAAAIVTTSVLAVAGVLLAGVISAREVAESSASVVWRIGGFVLAVCVMVLVVHTPLLIVLGWVARGQISRAAAAFGGAFLIYAVMMMIPMIETGSLSPFFWNLEGWVRRPLEFVTDWLPFLAGGAAFAAGAWEPPPRTPPA